jgi:ABC-2 type transport system permease protein
LNPRVIWAIARKDVAETFSGRAVWGPALVQPVTQLVLLPLFAYVVGSVQERGAFSDVPPDLIQEMLRQLPPMVAETLRPLPPGAMLAVLITGHLAAPAFVLPPMMVAMWAGSTAFVGEKERKTLEALLYTPATDAELLIGKGLAAVGPALLISWVIFGLYCLAENAATWSFMARWWFPTAIWWPWIFWVGPAAMVMATACTVAISARAKTQAAANQLGGVLGLFVSLVIIGQALGMLSTSPQLAWCIGTGMWVIDALLGVVAVRTFSRSRLIQRL